MALKDELARASRANANIELNIIVRLPDDISPKARFAILHQVCEDFFGRKGLPYAAASIRPIRTTTTAISAAIFRLGHTPGAPWPAELANGIWRYEEGRYGHGAAAPARTRWVENDARFRERIESSHPTSPILEPVDGLVVRGIRHTARWQDADVVRLLYPGVQQHLVAAYREQQEERVECLAAIANRTATVERRLVSAGTGAVRPVVMPHVMPPASADAFWRWRDDPDFYLDTGPNRQAIKAASERIERCANPPRRALAAARGASDPPAVLRLLEDRIAASRSNDEAVDNSGRTPVAPGTPSPLAKVRGWRKGRSHGPAPRRS